MCAVIELAILTKSSKNRGYCVAGIEIKSGEWVRLVSSDADSHGALFDRNMQYKNGGVCQILDVARVPILRSVSGEYQPENVLIDERIPWEKTGRLSVDELLALHPVEDHPNLLGNTYPYITKERIGMVGHSLALVMVNDLVITHPEERKTKAEFTYLGIQYRDMAVTDRDYYRVQNNTCIETAILVVSLPDAPISERKYYKFIAKIFPV